jgi:hypothetical protein
MKKVMKGTSGSPEITEGYEGLTEEDVGLTLDYLLLHKKEFIQEFLRERGLYYSGTKAVLRKRFEGYLGDGRLNGVELVALLNRIEGWGHQHIYLYKAPNWSIGLWCTEESARERLSDLGLIDLFNRQRPLVLPEETTLSSIEWTMEGLRFVWVEKRQWEERVPEEDIESADIVWRAHRIKSARGLTTFDWDLVSGHAMLMIQKLPSGTKYHRIRRQFEKELEPIVGLSQFEQVRVSRAIQPIEESGEVRRRQLAYETRRGGKARFTSASPSADTYADPDLERAGQALGGEAAGLLGNFYWHPVPGILKRELHSMLYASDQRVGIFGERREQEVRHIISRIRYYSGRAPRTG